MMSANSVTSDQALDRAGEATAAGDRQVGRRRVSELVHSAHTHSYTWSDAGLMRLYRRVLGLVDIWYDVERVRVGLPEAVLTLPDRLVVVVYFRYEKEMALKVIGGMLQNRSRKEKFRGTVGVTPERVRQMEIRALRQMRHPSRTRLFICKQRHSLPGDIAETWVELSGRFKRDWQGSGYNYNAMVMGFR